MDIHHPTHVDMRVGEIPNGLPKTHVGWIKYAMGIPISNPQPVYFGYRPEPPEYFVSGGVTD
jgi:hypothetical protein